jgi:hypothetical protein
LIKETQAVLAQNVVEYVAKKALVLGFLIAKFLLLVAALELKVGAADAVGVIEGHATNGIGVANIDRMRDQSEGRGGKGQSESDADHDGGCKILSGWMHEWKVFLFV